jgi:phospholipid-binding lipoprotein MlaA
MRTRTNRLQTLAWLALAAAASACSTANGPDPYRRLNQPIFQLNEGVDKILLEPVAEGYDTVTAHLFQTMIGNFFVNLTVPRTFLNDLLQAKPLKATQDVGRLVVNVIAGMGGFIDAASEMGIPKNEEDFGQTLGRWGVGPGPYLVLPLAGPNDVRDTLTAPLDVATNPTTWVNVFGLSIVRVVNTRAQYLEEIDQARKDAVDYYVFVRDAYLSSRERAVRDGLAPRKTEEDLYDLDEDDSQGGETTDAQ